MAETDFWTMIIQGLLMLQEFRKFGLINCRMAPWCISWTSHKTILYYPRSFVGLHKQDAVDVKGTLYTPEEDIDKNVIQTGDVFNLALILHLLIKPDFEFYDPKTQDFDMDELLAALDDGEVIFMKNNNTSYSKELNDLMTLMLEPSSAKRPTVSRIQ